MTNPGDPNPPRMSAEDAFLDMLTDYFLETLERPARETNSLQRFFRPQECRACRACRGAEPRILGSGSGVEAANFLNALVTKSPSQAALVDVLASANLLRLPV